MTRGSIVWVNFGASSPPEFGKTRPAIVVSNTVHNDHLDSVVVIPLSSVTGAIWPLRLEITTSLAKTAFAVVPGIRQVSKMRIIETVGPALDSELARLDAALREYLGE